MARVLLLSCLFLSFNAFGQISGTVFRDLDNNGVFDTGELPEGGIRVVAYNSNGDSVTQVITTPTVNSSGDNYTFTGLTLPVRLEFRIPDFVFPSKASTGSNVRFLSAATNAADLGLQYPQSLCQSNPDVFVPCYVAGNPEGGGTGGSLDAFVRFPYDRTGTSPKPTSVAPASAVGTVWGVTFQRETKKMILSTFLKRHCGLESLGLGGLFILDLNTSPGTVSPYINIENFGINLGGALISGRATLPASATTASMDPLAFDNVGKVGIGSIDLNDDGSVLWGVNLHTRQIFSFQIGNPIKPASSVTNADFKSFNIPNPACTNGVARPWALEFFEGKIYVGIVCTAESTGGTQSNLFAYVYQFDPVAEVWNTTPVASFSLNYPKGVVHTSYPAIAKWEPWISTWSGLYTAGAAGTPSAPRKMRPQPMLTDIQFDKRGDMILGLSDRTGHQTGRLQYQTSNTDSVYNGYIGGDILKLKANGTGAFILENNATFTGGPTGSGAGNNQGPGNGEFFSNDNYSTIHQETFMGGMLYHSGRDEIMVNQMDPLNIWTGGTVRHRASDGFSTESGHRYEIYNTLTIGGTFGKSSGLGQMELFCDPIPIQIGHRIWMDTDADGIQDAGEMGLAGVTVQLYQGSTLVGTATTNSQGYFVFDASNVTGGLKYNTNYQIRVNPSQSALTNKVVTSQNIGSNDDIDNDAYESGGMVLLNVTTGQSGENDFSSGIGFRNPPCSIQIVSATPVSCNQSSGTYTLDVTVTYSNQPAGNLNINGQIFTPNGSGSQTFTLTALPADGTSDIDVIGFFVNESTCRDTLVDAYDAPLVAKAGTDGTGFVCETDTVAINLFNLITGEDTGGTWVRTSGSGGSFDAIAGTFTAAVGATNSTFTYSVSGTSPCGIDESVALVIVTGAPFAGNDGTISVCGNVTNTLNLNAIITGEQAGGTWVRTSGTGGTFDALAGTFSLVPGGTTSTFTYTVPAAAPCTQPDQSVATIQVIETPNFTVSQTAATCTAGNPNNNGVISVTSVTGADKFGISIGATYAGPNYASSSSIPAAPFNVITNAPNTGQTYTLRFFNGSDSCFTEQVIEANANNCQPCPNPNCGSVTIQKL